MVSLSRRSKSINGVPPPYDGSLFFVRAKKRDEKKARPETCPTTHRYSMSGRVPCAAHKKRRSLTRNAPIGAFASAKSSRGFRFLLRCSAASNGIQNLLAPKFKETSIPCGLHIKIHFLVVPLNSVYEP